MRREYVEEARAHLKAALRAETETEARQKVREAQQVLEGVDDGPTEG
jgi:hypothetical protein